MKIIIGILLLLASSIALADDTELTYDRISLTGSAQTQVSNDTIIATLYAEEEGSQPAQLADSVNRRIKAAVNKLKQYSDIKLQTDSYTTSPVYHKSKIRSWRVRQSIRIESRNMARVSALLGQLQDSLALQGMHFSVSPDLRAQTDDALIVDALSSFKRRAELIAEQLGKRNYRIVNINISTSGGVRHQRSFAHAAMMQDSVAAPSVAAGEATMQVNVNGTIELE